MKEQIALFGQSFKKSKKRESLCRSLPKEGKEQFALLKRAKRAIRSIKIVSKQFVLFGQQTSDLQEKLKSEFPTLLLPPNTNLAMSPLI